MQVHYLQHVPFEALGSMEDMLREAGHKIGRSRLFAGDPLPRPDETELLIVMGGPMGIYDEDQYPWLKAEKAFIKAVLDHGNRVLGICLGAQLLADVLGARVYPGEHREIGWFPVSRAGQTDGPLQDLLPDEFQAFHWHGDTFDIPAGARLLGSSEACANQGFIVDDRVVALQFHLETTPDSAALLTEHCADELDGSTWVQSADTMLADHERFNALRPHMAAILNFLTR